LDIDKYTKRVLHPFFLLLRELYKHAGTEQATIYKN